MQARIFRSVAIVSLFLAFVACRLEKAQKSVANVASTSTSLSSASTVANQMSSARISSFDSANLTQEARPCACVLIGQYCLLGPRGGKVIDNIDAKGSATDCQSKLCALLLAKHDKTCTSAEFIGVYEEHKSMPAPVPSESGHLDPRPYPYDIFNKNCHTAANCSVKGAPTKRGVLVCSSQPENGDQGGHTAIWEVNSGGRTCIWNWGRHCCFQGKKMPPDLSSDGAKSCAMQACGDQYSPTETHVLPPGQKVEEPGVNACVEILANVKGLAIGDDFEDLKSCETCCDNRATAFSDEVEDEAPGTGGRLEYWDGCRDACFTDYKRKKGFRPDNNLKLKRSPTDFVDMLGKRCALWSSEKIPEKDRDTCASCCLEQSNNFAKQDDRFVNMCINACELALGREGPTKSEAAIESPRSSITPLSEPRPDETQPPPR